ncbi:MAG: DegT/DnrJ/EryC1/StrS family aminotransferase, partial [Microcystis panniformis]
GYQQGDFPNAETLCEEIVSLPMYPGIREEQIAIVVEQITAIIG